MILIDAVPKNLFFWGYDLYLGDAPLVSFDVSWVRERGEFHWEGVNYALYRESPWFGDFVASDGSSEPVVRATKNSAFLQAFTVQLEKREFCLKAASPFTRRFVLEEAGVTVGEICPSSLFSRKYRGEFREALPIPVCVFLFWLVVLMWRRQAAVAT